MKAKRPLLLLAALLAGFLACLELLARGLLPEVPDSTDVPRNPFRYRGWPEYMASMAKPGATNRVVLLSNCQGYGGEYVASRGYPLRLELLLREQAAGGVTDWEVLNWSVDGATSMEYVLMAAFLRLHPPAAVIAVTGYADYRDEHFRESVAYCRTDIPRLLSRPQVVRALPRTFRRRHLRIEPWMSFALSDHIALLRYKEYLWSWLDRRIPGIHNVFYAPEFSYLPWALPKRPWVKPLELPRGRGDAELQVSYGEGSRVMLREYLETLARIPARVVVVAEPTTVSDAEPFMRRFLSDLESMTRARGMLYWDLHDALLPDRFLSTVHLEQRNHIVMAEILAKRIQQMIDPGPEG